MQHERFVKYQLTLPGTPEFDKAGVICPYALLFKEDENYA